ncbi:hypothetical protein R3379_26790 [Bacillus sp. BAU-SS-2023]|nr:hypothetical protein [Bacillus sp. BAU-SS-2023]
MNKDRKGKIANFVKGMGSTVGSVASGMTTLAIPGVEGVFVATLVNGVIIKITKDVGDRILSERENKKIIESCAYSIEKISDNIQENKVLRDDGFFNNDGISRSNAEEIFEGILFSAQKEHEEKKLKYYGYLFANIAFDESVSKNFANQLINIADRLTYRQLQILAMYTYSSIVRNFFEKNKLPKLNNIEKISILQDTVELYRMGILNGGGEVILEIGYVNPYKIGVEPIGMCLFKLMNLGEITTEDYREIDNMVILLNNLENIPSNIN